MKTFVSALSLTALTLAKVSPDAFKSFEQIVQENGYTSESYTLTTPDDYVLSLYRIPGSLSELGTDT